LNYPRNCVRLLFVLFYIVFVYKCVLPPGDNPIAVNKYINTIYLPVHFTVFEVAFASCNLTTHCLRRYGASNLDCCGAEHSIRSPCVFSSGQTYSNFAVRPVMRLSCPEFPNLCIRTSCLLTVRFQMFMHRLFQITSSDVNYT
jgi:hypothetical protein